jgi:galactonate dehydratase
VTSVRPKIDDVRTIVVGTSWRNLVFVEVQCEDGIVGVGEATTEWFDEAIAAHARSLAERYAIGRDPFDVEALVAEVLRNDYWPTNVVLNSALAAIEMACWDLIGKLLDQPVYRLLGGAVRERMPAYANGWYRVARNPDAFARAAAEAVARGYRSLKVDPFGAGGFWLSREEHELAGEILAAIRGAVGPEVELCVDAHGRFSVGTARQVASWLAGYRVRWLEEPVPSEALGALKDLRVSSSVPLAAGERVFSIAQAQALLATEALDVFQPDPIHCGGLLQTKRICALADLAAVPVALHDSSGPVATAACLHLHVSTQNALVQEAFDEFDEPWITELAVGAPEPRDGHFELPERPGLGVELDLEVAAAHPARRLDFHHWQEGWERRGEAEPEEVRSVGERVWSR